MEISTVSGIVGVVIVLITLFDALLTTLAPRQAGPISKRLAHGWWHASLAIYRRTGFTRILSIAGPAILVVVTLFWVIGLWSGWTLIFESNPDSIIQGDTKVAATLPQKIYYAGFVLFTLGTGDFVPEGDLWRIMTNVATFTGLSVITLALTFCLTVIGAVAFKRQLAGVISNLGSTSHSILSNFRDGNRIEGLDQYMTLLTSEIEMHNQQHQAYPILHYFYSRGHRNALAPSLARLGEALFLLRAVDPEAAPARGAVIPVERAIAGLLQRISGDDVKAESTAPPAPSLEPLRQAGIPITQENEFEDHLKEKEKLRGAMLGLVRDSGWEWDDINRDE